MKILMTGGTGLIGRHFIKQYPEHEYTVLTRSSSNAFSYFGEAVALLTNLDDLVHLDDFDAVINLAGEPIADHRWTPEQKQKICQSRWTTTNKLVDLIKASSRPPETFISGSAIGIYGPTGDTLTDERDFHFHQCFSHQVCATWEETAMLAAAITRTVIIRTGVVLSMDGGALPKMVMPFKFGVGGPIGSGEQYLSWIHIDDMVRGIAFLLEHPALIEPFNLTAPTPVTNNTFSRCLAKTLKRPNLFRMPAFMMRLIMGESSELVLASQRIIPYKLQQAGFEFTFPQLEDALKDLLSKQG